MSMDEIMIELDKQLLEFGGVDALIIVKTVLRMIENMENLSYGSEEHLRSATALINYVTTRGKQMLILNPQLQRTIIKGLDDLCASSSGFIEGLTAESRDTIHLISGG
jgi:hypothetical protein